MNRRAVTLTNAPTRIGGILYLEIGGKVYEVPWLPSDTGEELKARMVAAVPNLGALMGDQKIYTKNDRGTVTLTSKQKRKRPGL